MKDYLKCFSNWPSFPQCYINQKFIGGTEIILELVEQDEFIQLVPQGCIKENAMSQISGAMAQSLVVLFMKGTREEPEDGYQDDFVQLLDSQKINYTTFNVIGENDVREILKETARYNSFP